MKLVSTLLFVIVSSLSAQEQTVVAIIDLARRSNAISREDILAIGQRIAQRVSQDKSFFVFDRELVAPVLAEQGFTHIGTCSDKRCLSNAGSLLAAQKVIGGSIARNGNVIRLELFLVDVADATIENSIRLQKHTSRADFLSTHLPESIGALINAASSVEPRVSLESGRKRRWWIPVSGVLLAGAAAGAGMFIFNEQGPPKQNAGETDIVSLDDVPERRR